MNNLFYIQESLPIYSAGNVTTQNLNYYKAQNTEAKLSFDITEGKKYVNNIYDNGNINVDLVPFISTNNTNRTQNITIDANIEIYSSWDYTKGTPVYYGPTNHICPINKTGLNHISGFMVSNSAVSAGTYNIRVCVLEKQTDTSAKYINHYNLSVTVDDTGVKDLFLPLDINLGKNQFVTINTSNTQRTIIQEQASTGNYYDTWYGAFTPSKGTVFYKVSGSDKNNYALSITPVYVDEQEINIIQTESKDFISVDENIYANYNDTETTFNFTLNNAQIMFEDLSVTTNGDIIELNAGDIVDGVEVFSVTMTRTGMIAINENGTADVYCTVPSAENFDISTGKVVYYSADGHYLSTQPITADTPLLGGLKEHINVLKYEGASYFRLVTPYGAMRPHVTFYIKNDNSSNIIGYEVDYNSITLKLFPNTEDVEKASVFNVMASNGIIGTVTSGDFVLRQTRNTEASTKPYTTVNNIALANFCDTPTRLDDIEILNAGDYQFNIISESSNYYTAIIVSTSGSTPPVVRVTRKANNIFDEYNHELKIGYTKSSEPSSFGMYNYLTINISAQSVISQISNTDTIFVDRKGYSQNYIDLKSLQEVFENTSLGVPEVTLGRVPGAISDKIHVETRNDYVRIYVDNLGENNTKAYKNYDVTAELKWGNDKVNWSFVISQQGIDYEQIISSVSKSTTYDIGNDLYYRLLDADNNNQIFVGKVDPSITTVVRLNNIVKDYIVPNHWIFGAMNNNNNESIDVMLQTSADNTSWKNAVLYRFYYNYTGENDSTDITDNYNNLSMSRQPVDYVVENQFFVSSIRQDYGFKKEGLLTVENISLNINQTEKIIYLPKDDKTITVTYRVDGDTSVIGLEAHIKDKTLTVTKNIADYKIKCSNANYVLYYINIYGGWNWMPLAGKKMMKSVNVTRNTVIDIDNNTRVYKSDWTNSYDLNTDYISDDTSEKLKDLFISPVLWLHDLENDKIIEVNCDAKKYDVKTYRNQGKKFVTVNIKFTECKTNEQLR